MLILDEPTASLDQDATDMLFARIREVVTTGTSVIYITHRLAELRQIAHRVTVLRDGRVRGGGLVDEISDADLLGHDRRPHAGLGLPAEIVDRRREIVILSVSRHQRQGLQETSASTCARGQIVGIAGVAGNGQAELMRALAGLQAAEGADRLSGRVAQPTANCCARGGLHAVRSPCRRRGRRLDRSRERLLRRA